MLSAACRSCAVAFQMLLAKQPLRVLPSLQGKTGQMCLQVVLPEAGQPASPSGAGGAGQGRFPAPIRSPISPELNAASGQSVLDAAAEFEQTAIRRAKAAEAR